MKPFDLKAAMNGSPVCTKIGYDVRIICFDRVFDVNDNYECKPIVALVYVPCVKHEFILDYYPDGRRLCDGTNGYDLQMK